MQQQVTYTVMASVMTLALSSGPQLASNESWFPHPPKPFEAPVVFQAAGPNIASIQGTVDQYRLALGDPLNGNAPGPLAAGRREINWDGGGNNSTTSPGPTPFDVFLNTRGAQMTTPGSGFVQAPPSGIADLTGNASYADIFKTFSPLRLFAVLDSTLTRVKFFLPGSNGAVPATTKGFGAVFTDVDQPDGAADFGWKDKASTFVEYLRRLRPAALQQRRSRVAWQRQPVVPRHRVHRRANRARPHLHGQHRARQGRLAPQGHRRHGRLPLRRAAGHRLTRVAVGARRPRASGPLADPAGVPATPPCDRLDGLERRS